MNLSDEEKALLWECLKEKELQAQASVEEHSKKPGKWDDILESEHKHLINKRNKYYDLRLKIEKSKSIILE